MACMADDQKEDTDMDQLHNFLQNTLPRVAKTHNLDITAELESLRSKLQISTDRVSKSNSNVEMLLANRLRNISMDHNDDFGHRELGCKSGDGKSDNTLKQSKRASSDSSEDLPQALPSKRTGRLRRRKFSFKYETLSSEMGQAKNTLRQAIIFTRHGTRLPLHNFPNDKSWPCDEKFWDAYSGILSPVGHAEMHALGSLLRGRYVEEYNLFDGVNPCDRVEVHSTHSLRTLQSAANLCMGLFPTLPIYYTVVSDRLGDGITTEDLLHSRDSNRGICICIDTMSDNLLRQAKSSESFSLWKKKRQEDPWLKNKCKDPVVLELLDKLWKLSGYPKLDPSINTPPQRLRKMCVIYTQLKIAERHNLEPFLNDEGITLTSGDIEIIAEVARHVWATKYNRRSPLERSSGRAAAGYVVHEISRNMMEMVEECKSKQSYNRKDEKEMQPERSMSSSSHTNVDEFSHPPPKMVIYSAHDGTILSLLARFGIDKMKEAEFGGNIIFELHEKQPGKFTVEFRYNNDPNIFGESKKIPVTSERVDEYLSYGLLENGDVPLEAFTTFYTLEKLAESQQAFLDLHMKVRGFNPNMRASKFKKFLHNNYIRKGILKRKASIAKALGGAYALEVWKKHEVVPILRDAFIRASQEGIPWAKQFRALDMNGDGYVTFDELNKVLISIMKVDADQNALKDFVKLFDANDDGMVTVKEFVAFMNDFIISDVK